jgi:hypothetical protein
MNDILNKSTVLVLNRNWQAVNVRTPQEAFCMMATNVATGLEIEGEHNIRPVTWEEWITLPIRLQDNPKESSFKFLHCSKGQRLLYKWAVSGVQSGGCAPINAV